MSDVLAATSRRKAGRAYAPALVHDVLRTPGEPLEQSARASMESRFGRDFSRVRVHRDERAADSAQAVGAGAYTVGHDVVFGRGRFSPHTEAGSRLLAHELGHVVQQRNVEANASQALEIGEGHDQFERDADASASAEVSGAPRLQRGLLDTLRDIALFIPRLFGAGGYSDEELKDYLKGLKDRHAIENGIFSDNKARGCVDAGDEKRLTALGAPYDLEVKRLLVEEMITGYASFLDERAVIKLLRRQTDADIQQIVTQIGRDKIWNKFSGGNRRIIEALTMTADDAKGDKLVARLRGLAPDQIRDYENNARDSEVKAQAHKALVFANTTAPVPNTATLTPNDESTFPIVGVNSPLDIVVERDTTQAIKSSGETACNLEFASLTSSHGQDAAGKISSCQPATLRARLLTRYDPGANPTGQSAYGRGTTDQDKAQGNTTLKFHESQHGQDCFDYLKTYPIPMLNCPIGGTEADYQKEHNTWVAALEAYNRAAGDYSFKKTDCPGTPKNANCP